MSNMHLKLRFNENTANLLLMDEDKVLGGVRLTKPDSNTFGWQGQWGMNGEERHGFIDMEKETTLIESLAYGLACLGNAEALVLFETLAPTD